MPRLALRALLLATLFALAGCASLAPKIETPTVELTGVQVLSGDMFSQRFMVRVKVQNPNDIEVPVESIEFTAFLMGDRFGEGASYSPFVLPAMGEAEFDMYITTNFVSGFGRLVEPHGRPQARERRVRDHWQAARGQGPGAHDSLQPQGPGQLLQGPEVVPNK